MHKVFVYGTLKAGKRNHPLLAGRAFFCGNTTIAGSLHDLGPYPALKKGKDVVFGEVYFVGDRTLADLDKLECHPILYKREEVTSLCNDHKAWVYFYEPELPPNAKSIIGGKW